MSKRITATVIVTIVIGVALFLFIDHKSDEQPDDHRTDENYKINDSEKLHTDEQRNGGENMAERKLVLTINHQRYTATLSDNSTANALVAKLQEGSLTIDMSDYANMEKVGSLGFDLPENNENIDTEAGDIILYQGHSFVIYYDQNHWDLTRLGKMDHVSQEELKKVLGNGDVTVVLSLD